jgi:protein-S-isoprenylcysteine O-methyltransferase Ste14
MIPFSAIFSVEFFFSLGYVVLSIAGLVLAISYRRTQEGKVSLFLLLTTALVAAYYTMQWVLSSFVSFYVSNYAAAHADFQLPSWVNVALTILFTALNFAFIVTLGLTAWFAVRKNRADRLVLTQGPEELSSEELASESAVDVEQSGATDDNAAPAEPSVPGPEA